MILRSACANKHVRRGSYKIVKNVIWLLCMLTISYTGNSVPADSLLYFDAAGFPVLGKGFENTQTRYERLPSHLETQVRKPVWDLSKNCSGMAIRFRTNSTVIAAKWEVTNDVFMNHFAMTGIKGLDLYCLKDGKWQFVNVARPTDKTTKAIIIQNMPGNEMEYMLYLPLYDGLGFLEIGIEKDAMISDPSVNSPQTGHPLVFYGTSITQGGCASRAGMSYTSILSRMLDKEVVNLGFSGNGQLDLEVAEAMAEIDACCYVMDCLPNVSVEQMNEKYIPFLKILRARHPETPIVLIENIRYPYMYFDQKVFKLINEKNETLRKIYGQQKSKGDKNLYYIKGDKLIGHHKESTVDGTHLTDLGFKTMAENLYPSLKRHIGKK